MEEKPGCAEFLLILVMLLWFALVPFGLLAMVSLLRRLPAVTRDPVIILVFLVLCLVVYLPLIGLTAGRRHLRRARAVALSLGSVSLYLALWTIGGILFPTKPTAATAVRLLILAPYLLTGLAWLHARERGLSWREVMVEIGLGRPLRPRLLLMALAMGAVLVMPWPLVGSLGSVWGSLGNLLQALPDGLLVEILLHGFILTWLSQVYTRRGGPVWLSSLMLGLLQTGNVLSFAALTSTDALLLPPFAAAGSVILGLLLAQLQLSSGGYLLAPITVAYLYRVVPLLFVDPRSEFEVLHIGAHIYMIMAAAIIALLLWPLGRFIEREAARPPWSGIWRPALPAALLWGLFLTIYITLGVPGFHQDGFLIVLKEQADLSEAPAISDRVERIRFVCRRLTETALRTQGPIREELEKMGLPYRPYYIVNMIRVDGHRELMSHFAARPDVDHVADNLNVRRYPRRLPMILPGRAVASSGVEWNLREVEADKVWDLAVTGQGIVVAGADSGYSWDHPALIGHYRGWDGVAAHHDYNWHDAWDGRPVPWDDDSHGTHTMGIIVGDDGAGNRVGMAPGARWMGCRNMRNGIGNPGAYAECMEFLLAPYPYGGDPFRDGDPAMAPHVINNSWGCPEKEGCTPDSLRLAVEHLQAAGIMVVASVGNDGPACSTAKDPIAIHAAAFAVGATEKGGRITDFSSRGPVTADGSNRMKPDISAPGADVRSSVPGGGYGIGDGTSMAGPHVTGLVALLWSAAPDLVGDIDRTEKIIGETATPHRLSALCEMGGTGETGSCACTPEDLGRVPNNVYGWGEINAFAAVRRAMKY
jgi:serine protease AprX